MSDTLFVSTVKVEEGQLFLGFSVGTPVTLGDATRKRDLPGGLTEYAMTVSSGDKRFELRTVADAEGRVSKVLASTEAVLDDWHE